MTSYLRSWLYSGTSTVEPNPDSDPLPVIERISPPPDEEDDGEETETERKDDDRPPAFPALNSAQRAQSSQLPAILTDSQLMPPPPLPSLALRQPGTTSKTNMLAAPPRTLKPPAKPSKKREKVALAPGFGPLDWAALKSSGTNLRVSTPPSLAYILSAHAIYRALIPSCVYHPLYSSNIINQMTLGPPLMERCIISRPISNITQVVRRS